MRLGLRDTGFYLFKVKALNDVTYSLELRRPALGCAKFTSLREVTRIRLFRHILRNQNFH